MNWKSQSNYTMKNVEIGSKDITQCQIFLSNEIRLRRFIDYKIPCAKMLLNILVI